MIWSPTPASAEILPCDIDDPDCETEGPVNPTIPYQAPAAGLGYSLDPRAEGWKAAWYSRDNAAKPWARESYDPNYVNPTKFPSTFFNQCFNEADWHNERDLNVNTVNTYRWIVDGVIKDTRRCYFNRIDFIGQGIHDVKHAVRVEGQSLWSAETLEPAGDFAVG